MSKMPRQDDDIGHVELPLRQLLRRGSNDSEKPTAETVRFEDLRLDFTGFSGNFAATPSSTLVMG